MTDLPYCLFPSQLIRYLPSKDWLLAREKRRGSLLHPRQRRPGRRRAAPPADLLPQPTSLAAQGRA